MKGLIADANIQGHVENLVWRMQRPPWAEFWLSLELRLYHFEDVGLARHSTDLEIWNVCQSRELVLVTDNRNRDSDHSLEAVIRRYNDSNSLPVFTIADMNKFRTSSAYVERVIEAFYVYLLRIAEVRGTGRLYLP